MTPPPSVHIRLVCCDCGEQNTNMYFEVYSGMLNTLIPTNTRCWSCYKKAEKKSSSSSNESVKAEESQNKK